MLVIQPYQFQGTHSLGRPTLSASPSCEKNTEASLPWPHACVRACVGVRVLKGIMQPRLATHFVFKDGLGLLLLSPPHKR